LHLRARATLWIVGDGDQRKGLEEAAQGLANERKIKFWGALPNQRLPDFYAAADVLVVPSVQDATGDTEGQGVVLLEAFAGRVCVLASRVGGIANVVRDNFTGLLVEPDDPRALAAGLETLLLDPELRATLADNAYAHVRERYGWRKVAGEFAALYQRLICSSGS
jgi:glycosyltransferase involved in cell wall biosynthesis